MENVLIKHKWATSLLITSALLLALSCGSVVAYDGNEASIVGLVVGALVGVVVAVALIPTIANQTAGLESNSDLDSSEQTLVGLWPLFIIVGVMMAIIGMAL